MSVINFSPNQISVLDVALNPSVTKGQLSPPVLDKTNKNAQSPNADENPTLNTPSNTPIAASGNADKAATAIKKSNMNISHACDSSSYVGKSIAEVNSKAAQLARAIRDAVKAALAALGISPAGSALVSQVKKIAGYIKNIKKFIKEIADYTKKYIGYLNEMKKFIELLLSLPVRVVQYFADCVKLVQRQISAGFGAALATVTAGASDINRVIKDVNAGLNQVNQSLVTYTAANEPKGNLSYPGVDPESPIFSDNPVKIDAAVTATYSGAGYEDASKYYGAKP